MPYQFLVPVAIAPFVDSGRGSSIQSKQSSQGPDEEVAAPAQRRVELRDEASPNKRRFQDISTQLPADNEDEVNPDLDLEVLTEGELELELELELGSDEEMEPTQSKRFCVGVQPPPFVYPKSQYEGYKHPLPKEKEWLVVKELLVGVPKCVIAPGTVTDRRTGERVISNRVPWE